MTSPATPNPLDDPVRAGSDAHRPPLVGLALALEEEERLDPVVEALRPVADALVAEPSVRDLLLGRSMGHSLHPLLTDVPIGAWISAIALDLVGGEQSRPAARRLVGLGILSTVPTALTGLADWGHTGRRDRRVGVAHASLNSVAVLLFGASWISRGRDHHGRGTVLALLGGAVVGASGFLGAHLSLARNVSARDESFAGSLPLDEAGRAEEHLTH